MRPNYEPTKDDANSENMCHCDDRM